MSHTTRDRKELLKNTLKKLLKYFFEINEMNKILQWNLIYIIDLN